MSDYLIEVDGVAYVQAEGAADKSYDLAIIAASTALTAMFRAVADFIQVSLVERQEIDIPQLIAFLRDRAEHEDYLLEFGRGAVQEVLQAYYDRNAGEDES